MAIVLDTTSIPGQTIVYDNPNGGVAIDYSAYYERLATAAEAIQASLGNIETAIERIKVLADPDEAAGLGVRVAAPYYILERALLWAQLFANVNNVWDIDNPPSAEALQGYLDSAREFVTAFENEFGDLK